MNSFFAHVKEIIGLIIVMSGLGMLWYIVIKYGSEKEVLFTVLGGASNMLLTVLGAYYTINEVKKLIDTNNANQQVSTTTTTSVTTPEETAP